MLNTPYRDLLTRYLIPQTLPMLVLTLLLLVGTALQLVQPQIVRTFIDAARGDGAVQTLVVAALLYLGAALLLQVVTVVETFVAENVGWTATNALRRDLAEHCLSLDMSFHNAHTPGELIERIDGDVTALANFLSRFIIRVGGSVLLLLGVLILLYREDWRIGAVYTLLSLAALLALRIVRRAGSLYALARRQASAELVGFLEERISGLVDIQANGAQPHVMHRLSGYLRDLFHAARTSMLMGGVLGSVTEALFTLGTVVAMAVGATSYLGGTMTLGGVYVLIQYVMLLRQPLGDMTRQMQDFQSAAASVTRVRQLMGMRRGIVDGRGVPLPEGPLSVAFHNVSFTYPRTDHRSTSIDDPDEDAELGAPLQGISFTLEPGKVLGLLGRTGSGKSTLSRLLFRLYDSTAGLIELGHVDIREMRLAELHRRVGMVTQEVQLFHATVRDNVTLFNPGIPDMRIIEVLEELGLSNWYRGLSCGLETELFAGGGLSAGEAQLLACARLFLRDPGLVILDEASSRLDPATEQLVERTWDRLLENRTGIVIAHRLETLRRADDVVILEGGRIVEHGSRTGLALDPTSRFHHLLAESHLETRRGGTSFVTAAEIVETGAGGIV